MPSNFLHIGMILTAFPEAKILHCVRDARAICWSNFRNYYSQNSIPWSYDLDDVVTYYGLYSNLMSFWKNIFGEKIYDVNYEALVTEPDGEIKKIISHIGLPWEETCLSPHKNNRIVGTASSNQVKNKIYQGSSEIWKNYLSHLERSFDVLPETV